MISSIMPTGVSSQLSIPSFSPKTAAISVALAVIAFLPSADAVEQQGADYCIGDRFNYPECSTYAAQTRGTMIGGGVGTVVGMLSGMAAGAVVVAIQLCLARLGYFNQN